MPSNPSSPAVLPDVCLAILNWNGKHHLEHLLPSLLVAKERYRGNCRILVLDNPSAADDLSWVREHFPEVDAVAAPENDFLYSYNWLLAQLEQPVVVLLNNDLKVDADFLEPLVEPFVDPEVFAVGAKSLEWDGSAVTSAAYRLTLHHGWGYWDGFESDGPVHTFFAVGGFAAVDRRKFLELGGFDRLYHPAYGEDADLSFRAWARGWTSIYQPKSVVWHREGASWDGAQATKRSHLMARAQYLFNRRHCRSPGDRLQRMIYLRILARQKRAAGDHVWPRAIEEARIQWKKAGKQLPGERADEKVAREALGKVGTPWVAR